MLSTQYVVQKYYIAFSGTGFPPGDDMKTRTDDRRSGTGSRCRLVKTKRRGVLARFGCSQASGALDVSHEPVSLGESGVRRSEPRLVSLA